MENAPHVANLEEGPNGYRVSLGDFVKLEFVNHKPLAVYCDIHAGIEGRTRQGLKESQVGQHVRKSEPLVQTGVRTHLNRCWLYYCHKELLQNVSKDIVVLRLSRECHRHRHVHSLLFVGPVVLIGLHREGTIGKVRPAATLPVILARL